MSDPFALAFDELLIAVRFCKTHLDATLAQMLVLHVALRHGQVEETETSLAFHVEKAEFYAGQVRRRADQLTEAFWQAERDAAYEAALLEDAEREGE